MEIRILQRRRLYGLSFQNKAHRNAVSKKVMAEMNNQPMPEDMPFDMKRMAYGGFKTLVQG